MYKGNNAVSKETCSTFGWGYGKVKIYAMYVWCCV